MHTLLMTVVIAFYLWLAIQFVTKAVIKAAKPKPSPKDPRWKNLRAMPVPAKPLWKNLLIPGFGTGVKTDPRSDPKRQDQPAAPRH